MRSFGGFGVSSIRHRSSSREALRDLNGAVAYVFRALGERSIGGFGVGYGWNGSVGVLCHVDGMVNVSIVYGGRKQIPHLRMCTLICAKDYVLWSSSSAVSMVQGLEEWLFYYCSAQTLPHPLSDPTQWYKRIISISLLKNGIAVSRGDFIRPFNQTNLRPRRHVAKSFPASCLNKPCSAKCY